MVARVGQGVYKVGEVPHLVIIQPLAAIQVGGVCVCVCLHACERATHPNAGNSHVLADLSGGKATGMGLFAKNFME